jgi:HPt (histidine-containing phosphotransfer) domain-containing protein
LLEILDAWLVPADQFHARSANSTKPERDPESVPGDAAIDMARWRAAQHAMGEDFPVLVGEFLTSTARLVAEVEAAARRFDAATIATLGHTLRSSAATLGAMRLETLAANLEGLGRERSDGLEAAADSLATEFKRVCATLEQIKCANSAAA